MKICIAALQIQDCQLSWAEISNAISLKIKVKSKLSYGKQPLQINIPGCLITLRKKNYCGFSSKVENWPKEVMLGLFSARKRKTLGTVQRNVCRNAFFKCFCRRVLHTPPTFNLNFLFFSSMINKQVKQIGKGVLLLDGFAFQSDWVKVSLPCNGFVTSAKYWARNTNML